LLRRLLPRRRRPRRTPRRRRILRKQRQRRQPLHILPRWRRGIPERRQRRKSRPGCQRRRRSPQNPPKKREQQQPFAGCYGVIFHSPFSNTRCTSSVWTFSPLVRRTLRLAILNSP